MRKDKSWTPKKNKYKKNFIPFFISFLNKKLNFFCCNKNKDGSEKSEKKNIQKEVKLSQDFFICEISSKKNSFFKIRYKEKKSKEVRCTQQKKIWWDKECGYKKWNWVRKEEENEN